MAKPKTAVARQDQLELVAPAAAPTFVVYRTKTDTLTINGAGISCDVRDGALIFTGPQGSAIVFGPGQWISVNVAPL